MPFVQLASEDAKFLLQLIEDYDSETDFTARQREYTIPKLNRIANPGARESTRLAYQDIRYLSELLEDVKDDPDIQREDNNFQRCEMILVTLEEIRQLQAQRHQAMSNIDDQRAARRARRNPELALQEKFERVQ